MSWMGRLSSHLRAIGMLAVVTSVVGPTACETACSGFSGENCSSGNKECNWSGAAECVPRPTPYDSCSGFTQADCGTHAVCQWAIRCHGTPIPCDGLHDATQCRRHPSCEWRTVPLA